jgi:acetoacetyl-CoA synthetase
MNTSSTTASIDTGTLLWTPSTGQVASTRIADYQRWLELNKGLKFSSYQMLWEWSIQDIDAFWETMWDFFEIQSEGSRAPVTTPQQMPLVEWYPGIRLNYAEHVFRNATSKHPALLVHGEEHPDTEMSWAELERLTGAFASGLRGMGVQCGDRVASYMPNRPEAVAAFLACASIGAIWSNCSPDMGVSVVVDRFRQIEPSVLLAVDSYTYNERAHDRTAVVEELARQLPSVRKIIRVPGPLAREDGPAWRDQIAWADATSNEAPLTFERVSFSHPLWILYSSGTTGLPKAIVHGHGGIVLTHNKILALHHDLRPGDRMLFLGSTGWMVWNLLVGGLLVGATIVLYDGHPSRPDPGALWHFMAANRVTHLGCGAAYLIGCMKDGLRPKDFAQLDNLRAIHSTGSPLPNEAYGWVYDAVKSDLWLASISGGTDIASGFVGGVPSLPVTAGEIQCRELGVAVYAFDDHGNSIVGEVGELVVTRPMPSMPIYFWNDAEYARYRESYFEHFPGVWRHGDWIKFSARGTAIIYGRSDTTINRNGIRIGTAEIYRIVEALPEVRDSMAVDLEYLGRLPMMLLFVVLESGQELDNDLKARITHEIRTKASARHVPDDIYAVDEVPRTLTGKKMELPIRKLLLGSSISKVANTDAMLNPQSLDYFVRLAGALN